MSAVASNRAAFDRGQRSYTVAGGIMNLLTPKPGLNPVTDASGSTSGGTLRTGAGFNQLSLDDKGKLITSADVKKATDGTLTAVSNEGDTQGKILNLLEQTYNLHVEGYNNNKKNERFKGFTAGL